MENEKWGACAPQKLRFRSFVALMLAAIKIAPNEPIHPTNRDAEFSNQIKFESAILAHRLTAWSWDQARWN
jgi:hypothetical protein